MKKLIGSAIALFCLPVMSWAGLAEVTVKAELKDNVTLKITNQDNSFCILKAFPSSLSLKGNSSGVLNIDTNQDCYRGGGGGGLRVAKEGKTHRYQMYAFEINNQEDMIGSGIFKCYQIGDTWQSCLIQEVKGSWNVQSERQNQERDHGRITITFKRK